MAERYATIVADPPWRYKTTLPGFGGVGERSAVPYDTMTVEEIAALPVREWAAKDAHLYLWTTNTHIGVSTAYQRVVRKGQPD